MSSPSPGSFVGRLAVLDTGFEHVARRCHPAGRADNLRDQVVNLRFTLTSILSRLPVFPREPALNLIGGYCPQACSAGIAYGLVKAT